MLQCSLWVGLYFLALFVALVHHIGRRFVALDVSFWVLKKQFTRLVSLRSGATSCTRTPTSKPSRFCWRCRSCGTSETRSGVVLPESIATFQIIARRSGIHTLDPPHGCVAPYEVRYKVSRCTEARRGLSILSFLEHLKSLQDQAWAKSEGRNYELLLHYNYCPIRLAY